MLTADALDIPPYVRELAQPVCVECDGFIDFDSDDETCPHCGAPLAPNVITLFADTPALHRMERLRDDLQGSIGALAVLSTLLYFNIIGSIAYQLLILLVPLFEPMLQMLIRGIRRRPREWLGRVRIGPEGFDVSDEPGPLSLHAWSPEFIATREAKARGVYEIKIRRKTFWTLSFRTIAAQFELHCTPQQAESLRGLINRWIGDSGKANDRDSR